MRPLSLLVVVPGVLASPPPWYNAHWIAPVAPVANGTFAAYRTSVPLPLASCNNASIAIAVDTKYWLYVNGQEVVFEGGLKRGPSPGSGYYDTLDLASAPWTAGHNSIAVFALYLGRKTVPAAQLWWNNEHSDSGMHALLFSGDICGTRIVSNASTWRAVPHPAYSNDITDDPHQNFRASEPDIVYDSSVTALKGWTAQSFDDSTWPVAEEKGLPGEKPWGELIDRPIPLFKRMPWRRYDSLRVVTDADDGDGFRRVDAADVGGHDIKNPGTSYKNANECKEACLAHSQCLAIVWLPNNGCALKSFSRYTPGGKYTVYLRAFRRLHAALPHDMQLTPTLKVPSSAISHGPVTSAAAAGRSPKLPRIDMLRIDMRTDSYRTDGSSADKAAGGGIPNNRAAYLVDGSVARSVAGSESGTDEGGGELYESPGWLVGHEVIYTVDKHASIALGGDGAIEVGYYESGYDVALAGAFECDVPALTTLWRKAQRTLFVNMRDNYMDCPDRERSQWWFDVSMDVHQVRGRPGRPGKHSHPCSLYIEPTDLPAPARIIISFYALSASARLLARKGILELAAWQKHGEQAQSYAPMSLYSPVPGHWVQELPNQSLQTIAYGIASYWDHTGDVDTMRTVLPAVVRYLLSWKLSARRGREAAAGADTGALVVPRACPGKAHAADVQCPGVWDWCDGESVNCDYAPIDNAWMYWALNSSARITRAVKATRAGGEVREADLRALEARAASIKAAFHPAFWDSGCGCYRSAAHRDRAGGTTRCAAKADNCTLPDDRANALAIVTGLAPRDTWKGIARGILDLGSNSSNSDSSNSSNGSTTTTATAATLGVAFASTAMEKFVLEAMFLAGEHDAALARMQLRFGRMIAHRFSTLWEHWEWDPTTGDPIAGPNHGWSGGALVLLSQYVTGLAPTSPGWATFDIRPRLGSVMRNASARVSTPHGEVRVAVTITMAQGIHAHAYVPHAMKVLATVPENSRARLHIPRKLGRPIISLNIQPTIPALKYDASMSVIDLPPGAWSVETRYDADDQ